MRTPSNISLMEQALTIDDVQDECSGLTTTEHSWLVDLNHVMMIVARATSTSEAVQQIMADRSCSEPEARRWVAKAHDYMSTGALTSANQARAIYHLRANKIYAECMANATRDEIKVTRKPRKVEVQVRNEDGKLIETQRKVVDWTEEVEIKRNVFNNAAVETALRAAKEAAHIMGGRPRDGSRTINIGQINQQNNYTPSAQETQMMGEEALAMACGLEIIEEVDATEQDEPEKAKQQLPVLSERPPAPQARS